jgi:hypothetical protein
LKSVKLFYSISRDAAPFEVPMTESSPGSFIGAVPENILSGVSQFTYYIAAENSVGAVSETRWNTVAIRVPKAGEIPPAGDGKSPGARPKWVVPSLIAGGVALAAGGAIIASNSGGGDGGGSVDPKDVAGTYIGECSLRTKPPDGDTTLDSQLCTIKIAPDGTVTSRDLYPGVAMTGKLTGDSFVLVATVNSGSLTGEIRYVGTVVDTRIVGSIQGTASSADGVTVYDGIFNAVYQ